MDKFTDLMVKDTVTGESLRADKLLEDIIDELLEKNPAMPSVRVMVLSVFLVFSFHFHRVQGTK